MIRIDWKSWKSWTVLSGLLILISSIVASCMVGGDEPDEINGITARDVPILVEEAKARNDGKTLDKLILDEDKEVLKDFYDLSKGPHGQNKDWEMPKEYRLVEYEANEETYYYLLEYPDTREGSNGDIEKRFFKVVRTSEGWKTFNHYDNRNWRYETQGLTPRVVKEVHDEP